MYGTLIDRHFAKIGARAKVYRDLPRDNTAVKIDIGHDDEGEYFDITVAGSRLADLRVLDAQPRVRHLLLSPRMESRSQNPCADTTSGIGSWRRFPNGLRYHRSRRRLMP